MRVRRPARESAAHKQSLRTGKEQSARDPVCATSREVGADGDHLTGIREGQTTNRAMAASGNRGRRINLRVAVVGSTTIRNVPFVHSASDLYLSQLQRNPQVSNLCALPVVRIAEFSGATFPKATLSQSYWLQRTRLDGSEGTLSQPSCNQHRACSSQRLRHLNMSWHRRNLSTTKPPRTRGSGKKAPEIDGDC